MKQLANTTTDESDDEIDFSEGEDEPVEDEGKSDGSDFFSDEDLEDVGDSEVEMDEEEEFEEEDEDEYDQEA